MLNEPDFRLIEALIHPHSITELSETTSYSAGYISQVIQRLEDYDLVTVTRDGHAKRVRTRSTAVVDAYRDLSATHSHVDFPELLSPSILRLCWFLDTPTTVAAITPHLAITRGRIYQLLQRLQRRGFVTHVDNEYQLVDDVHDLAAFAATTLAYFHRYRAQRLLPEATIAWAAPHEALVAFTPTATATDIHETLGSRENWLVTGLAAFESHDLDFLLGGPPAYYYSELQSALDPADLLCQTLRLTTDARRVSYCLLLMATTDIDPAGLRQCAKRYGIRDVIESLLTYLDSQGDRSPHQRLPDWPEFTRLATQYGVAV